MLFGERVGTCWVLARGWRRGDRLDDVRRWSFADPRAFAGQVRRLVRDATGDAAAARRAAADGAAWVAAHDAPEPANRDHRPTADGRRLTADG